MCEVVSSMIGHGIAAGGFLKGSQQVCVSKSRSNLIFAWLARLQEELMARVSPVKNGGYKL